MSVHRKMLIIDVSVTTKVVGGISRRVYYCARGYSLLGLLWERIIKVSSPLASSEVAIIVLRIWYWWEEGEVQEVWEVRRAVGYATCRHVLCSAGRLFPDRMIATYLLFRLPKKKTKKMYGIIQRGYRGTCCGTHGSYYGYEIIQVPTFVSPPPLLIIRKTTPSLFKLFVGGH